MPRTKTVVKLKRSSKPARQKKSAVDRINATLAKHEVPPTHVKLKTSDYLELLAHTLENGGEGLFYPATDYCSTAPVKSVEILPRKPKELLNTIRYLRKQAAKS